MKVKLLSQVPPEWKKPIRSYETRFLYIGFRRYDTFQKTLSSFHYSGNGVEYEEEPYEGEVFSRCYSTELAHVIVYSESPRVWVEELSPHERFVFVQQPTQATCT
jgi:hypothetical protein